MTTGSGLTPLDFLAPTPLLPGSASNPLLAGVVRYPDLRQLTGGLVGNLGPQTGSTSQADALSAFRRRIGAIQGVAPVPLPRIDYGLIAEGLRAAAGASEGPGLSPTGGGPVDSVYDWSPQRVAEREAAQAGAGTSAGTSGGTSPSTPTRQLPSGPQASSFSEAVEALNGRLGGTVEPSSITEIPDLVYWVPDSGLNPNYQGLTVKAGVVEQFRALADAHPGLQMGSSYRTYGEQARLYDLWKRGIGALAAPPGQSAHNSGSAVDMIGFNKAGLEEVERTAQRMGANWTEVEYTPKTNSWHLHVDFAEKPVQLNSSTPDPATRGTSPGTTSADRSLANRAPASRRRGADFDEAIASGLIR